MVGGRYGILYLLIRSADAKGRENIMLIGTIDFIYLPSCHTSPVGGWSLEKVKFSIRHINRSDVDEMTTQHMKI